MLRNYLLNPVFMCTHFIVYWTAAISVNKLRTCRLSNLLWHIKHFPAVLPTLQESQKEEIVHRNWSSNCTVLNLRFLPYIPHSSSICHKFCFEPFEPCLTLFHHVINLGRDISYNKSGEALTSYWQDTGSNPGGSCCKARTGSRSINHTGPAYIRHYASFCS